ncbi:hypothetical protein ABE17_06340 [Bacillus mycoides]|uniref:BREX system P-loop protein BrxC n=1 Tax=Bacillus mycoides TaxID=1405 RepID=UPI0018CD2815|nr:BREX system P-loop protein BrxC [Bacillus mycoides]MBG9596519.1 hypothetical protein [Bacillus mycoides]
MLLKDMYLKRIDREIRGVIKVAQTDDQDIYQELDEYVVTQELHKHFGKFYGNYRKGVDGRTDKMGVWISGFFGSGKSHFLKMLALLLQNKGVQGKKPVAFFEEKIQDPITYADMERVANVETEVILFNIDQKNTEGDDENGPKSILRAFMKVFYDHQGYFGYDPAIAEMQKFLVKEGKYIDFKREYEVLAEEPFEDRLETFYFDEDYIVGALVNADIMSQDAAQNWFNEGMRKVIISIEKFAKDVKEYIDSKGPNFHLVFLVDEIGQYIGDDRNLMLNLQTLTELLGSFSEGKAWIIVTSQESIDSIVKVKGDDFSRIQGRFDTRLSLSSISVDEVIKKRILSKNDVANDKLRAMYPTKSAILKNLISFKGSTGDFGGFESDQEFAEIYPFLPYQFKLLQKVFEQVRKHGSSGKHLSEGERSMLSAFKESALRFKDVEEGVLIPFYAFYETINEFLNPAISRVINDSLQNKNLKDDVFNTDLLKVLFMIKYVKEMPANIDNIATLMLTHIDEDKLALKERIQFSLRKLINETLVQKNGEEFVFLTDDEQDVNREIKYINVDEEIIKRELANYIFDDIYATKKFAYSKDYSFAFNQKMDEKAYGQQTACITLNILSLLSDDYLRAEQDLMMMSTREHQLIVKLGGNDAYREEMEEVLKIEEYRKKNDPSKQLEAIQNILNNKQAEAKERRRRVKELLEEAIKDASFYLNGQRIEVKGASPKEKLNNSMKSLVDDVYTKLNYIKEPLDNERDLIAILSKVDNQISFDDAIGTTPNGQALSDIFKHIELQEEFGKQVRVKTIYEHFENNPYGWKQLDIAGIIAYLLKEQRIRLRYNSEYLNPDEDVNKIITVLGKSADADKGIVTKRVQVDQKLIRTAKLICKDVFNKMNLPNDEDGLIETTKQLIEQQKSEINRLKMHYNSHPYPGLSLLNKGLEYFSEFTNKLDNVSFFKKLQELENDLLYWEDDMTPLRDFFESEQKDVFVRGLNILEKYQENKMYVDSDGAKTLVEELTAIIKNPIPYNVIQDIPELCKAFNQELENVLVEKRNQATQQIQQHFEEIHLAAGQYGVESSTKQRIEHYYTELKSKLAEFKDVYRIQATIQESLDFKKHMDNAIRRDIEEGQRKKAERQKEIEGGNITVALEPSTTSMKKESIKVTSLVSTKTLTTEEEVDQYVKILSTKLKEIIKSNKEIEFID